MESSPRTFANFTFGHFEVSIAQRLLQYKGKTVEIGARSFDILVALAAASGRVVSKRELMEAVWPKRVIEENTLESHMSVLRRALGEERGAIRTIAGRGYQFVAAIGVTRPSFDQETGVGLPSSLSPLIGRDDALDALADLVQSYRLVTLVGTGGVGKTRLAIETARRLGNNFPDRVCIAELANLSSGEYVAMSVAAALGFPPADGRILEDRVASVLSEQRILLVIDNCEHLVDAVACTVETILRASPFLHIIATSREFLRVEGERIYHVPTLNFPASEADVTDEVDRHSAVRLLDSRLTSAGFSDSGDIETARYKARICRRLDGIPLAIELAAAHVSALGLRGVAERLDDRFALLTRGWRAVPPRHQTLRGVLDWSYDLLPTAERSVFAKLSVFAGAFSLETAQAIVVDEFVSAHGVLDSIVNLVSKSLISATTSGPVMTYRMLETTRSYANERLLESGKFPATARRHAEYFLSEFERVESAWEHSESEVLVTGFREYHDDLRFALRWCFSDGGDTVLGIALVTAAVPYWMKIAYVAECHMNAVSAISQLDGSGTVDLRRMMKLRTALGGVLLYEGAAQDARAEFENALHLSEQVGDPDFTLKILSGLWATTYLRGPFDVSLKFAERFSVTCKTGGQNEDALVAERMLGASRFCLGNLTEARVHTERFLEHASLISNTLSLGFLVDHEIAAQCTLAHILWLQGFANQARAAMRCAIDRSDTINHALSRWYARLMCSCPLTLVMSGLSELRSQVDILSETARVHGMSMWKAHVDLWDGLVLSSDGDATAFDRMIDPVFVRFSGWHFNPCLTGLLAELCRQLIVNGKGTVAADLIAGAIGRAENAKDNCSLPELHRIKGEVVLSTHQPDAESIAEDAFLLSMELANERSLLSWSLRAALSMARLRIRQQRPGRGLVEAVRLRFTEGFDTIDVRAADKFLAEEWN